MWPIFVSVVAALMDGYQYQQCIGYHELWSPYELLVIYCLDPSATAVLLVAVCWAATSSFLPVIFPPSLGVSIVHLVKYPP